MIEQQKIGEIVTKIVQAIDPKRIVLFGSYADGRADDESDLDMLVVVKDSNIPKYRRARTIRKHLWGMCDAPKDIIVYTESEIKEWVGVKSSFIATVLEDGKVLYEN